MATRTRTRARQSPEETRTLIIDTVDALLRERPYRELNVDEIMRPTGYGRTIFYRHFNGFPAVIAALIERLQPELIEMITTMAELPSASVPEADTRERFERLVDFYAEHGRLARALQDAAVMDEDLERVLQLASARFIESVDTMLRTRGIMNGLPEASVPEAARALVGLVERYLGDTFGVDPPRADRETAVDVMTFLWRRVLIG